MQSLGERGVLVEIYKLYAAIVVTGVDGAVGRIECKTERCGWKKKGVQSGPGMIVPDYTGVVLGS